jgi:translocation and assembly module TamB
MRVAGIVLAAFGGLLLFVVLLVALLIGTQTGARLLLWGAAPVLPEGVAVGGVRGRLVGPLELHGVVVETDGSVIEVERLTLRWRPGRLWRGHLDVRDLAARGVRYRVRPTEPVADDGGFRLPERIDLPVAVTVRRAQLRDVEIWAEPGQAEPWVLRRAELAGRFVDARLELRTLRLEGPAVQLVAAADLVAAEDYPLTVTAEWRLAPEGFAPVAGTTRLAGTLGALQVRQEVAAPYELLLTGHIRDLLAGDEQPQVDLALTVTDLQLAEVGDLPTARISLSGTARGRLDALEVEVAASGLDPEGRRFESELAAAREPDGILLRRLLVTQPGRPGVLEGAGRIALGGGPAADLDISWESLQWPLTGPPTLESPSGRLRLTGPPDDFTFDLAARIEPLDQPPLDLTLQGEGGRASANAELDAQVAGGRIAGDVSLAWAEDGPLDVRATARLEGSGLDPSVLASEWPGSIDALVDGAARIGDGTITITLARLTAGGRLRGETFSAAAVGDFARVGDDNTTTVERLEVRLGSSRASASGRIGEALDLNWRATSDDLSELLPDAGGRISGSGTLVGRYPALRVGADLEGRQLAFGTAFGADELLARVDLDLGGARESVVEVTAARGALGDVEIPSVTLRGRGAPADHEVRLTLVADGADVAVELDGGFDEPWHETRRWRFVLREARLNHGELPPLRLAQNAEGVIGPDGARVERHCWAAADARLCLEGAHGPDGSGISADIAEVTFDLFAALAPPDLRVAGSIAGSMQLARSADGTLTGTLDLRSTAGEVVMPTRVEAALAGAGVPVLRFAPSQVALELGPQEAQLRGALNLEHGRLVVEATTAAAVVTGPDRAEDDLAGQPLAGLLEVDVPDLAFLDQLVPAIARPEGAIGGQLTLGGTLGNPLATGVLALRDGAATLNDARVRITDVTITLEGREREGIALEAVASSGGGEVRARGVMRMFGEPATAAIDIEGEDFEIMATDDARIFASPNLRVEASQDRIRVSGEVHVPRAEFTPGRRTAGAVTVSRDQVLVGAEPDVDPEPRDLHAEIRLVPGDEVYFSGFGLDARIEGDLRIVETPGAPTTATGELRLVDGEYRAYGQGLVIERGRIFFAGPVTEPAVDIEAVRRPREGILVGARVQGTLDQPEFSLFSDPTMPEQEQLAYLVLGRPLDEAPGGEGSALAQAALALGLRGGDALAQNIGGRLGVDELTIVTGPDEAGAESDPNQASLVVGAYLSPRLYVSYGIGLFQPGSVLQLQYDISRRWRLVTRSGAEGSGADLLFTLERGEGRRREGGE